MGGQGKSSQDNIHLFGNFFLGRGVLGGSWGLRGIRGHSLVYVLFLLSSPGLLGHLRGVVRRG